MKLRLHASGATQHVFEPINEDLATWLFKTPAFLDALLPGDAVKARTEEWPAVLRTLGRRPPASPLLRTWLRRARRRSFRRMGRILAELDAAGVGDVVAPFRWIPRASVLLDVGTRTLRYRGPLLQQRRADHFHEDARDLPRFDTASFITAQQRLWRAGFGITDAACALGPDGWATINGRTVLADTGSLTRDRDQARAVLADRFRESARRRHLRRADGGIVAEFHGRIYDEISEESLARAWGTGPQKRLQHPALA
ncbi:MAG TPA: hypothetical protein VK929_10600 [Longimicrobiales bacterium]|nr:hypothetical protein [Longimicrobiales bacterium]